MNTDDRVAKLRSGQRVVRKDSSEQGTVTEANGKVKVKWDRGSTSYFDPGKSANVRPKKGEQQ